MTSPQASVQVEPLPPATPQAKHARRTVVRTVRVPVWCLGVLALAGAWLVLASSALTWLALREWRSGVARDPEADLAVALTASTRLAHAKMLRMPVVSTIYVFALSYMAPYMSVFATRLWPVLIRTLRLLLPLYRRLRRVYTVAQWTSRARQKAVGRLHPGGSSPVTTAVKDAANAERSVFGLRRRRSWIHKLQLRRRDKLLPIEPAALMGAAQNNKNLR
jgi:hypothetical protein